MSIDRPGIDAESSGSASGRIAALPIAGRAVLGAVLGLAGGIILSIPAALSSLPEGQLELGGVKVSVLRVIAMYLIGTALAGVFVLISLPWARDALRGGLIGAIAALPIYASIWQLAGAHWDYQSTSGVIVAAVLVGGGLGAYFGQRRPPQ